MVHGDRTKARAHGGERAERHGLAGSVLQIDLAEIRGRLLIRLVDLEDDVIAVRRLVDGRDLARAEGAVEGVLDLVDGDAELRGLVAIDIDESEAIAQLQIGIDVLEAL